MPNTLDLEGIIKNLIANNLNDGQEHTIWRKGKYEPYSSMDFVEEYCQKEIAKAKSDITRYFVEKVKENMPKKKESHICNENCVQEEFYGCSVQDDTEVWNACIDQLTTALEKME